MWRRWLALGMTAAIGVVGLSACGGDDSSSSKTTAGSSGDGGSGTDDGGGTGNEELDALLEKARTAVIRVTYQTDSDSFTVSQDGANRALIQQDGSRLVEADGKAYTCDDGTCTEIPGGVGLTSMLTGLFGLYSFVAMPEMADNPIFDVTSSESREIAGRDATCTTIKAGALVPGEAQITACLDDETGVFLFGETSADDQSSKIEATEVGEPTDEDFAVTSA